MCCTEVHFLCLAFCPALPLSYPCPCLVCSIYVSVLLCCLTKSASPLSISLLSFVLVTSCLVMSCRICLVASCLVCTVSHNKGREQQSSRAVETGKQAKTIQFVANGRIVARIYRTSKIVCQMVSTGRFLVLSLSLAVWMTYYPLCSTAVVVISITGNNNLSRNFCLILSCHYSNSALFCVVLTHVVLTCFLVILDSGCEISHHHVVTSVCLS